MTFRIPIVASVVLVVLGYASESFAIPAFARRYEYACSNCHQFRPPELNAFGRRFRENGYQLPDGAEDGIRAKRNVEPGTLVEKLAIFEEVPLSIRGQVFGVVPRDPDAAGRSAYETRVFSYLMGGGSVYDDISFFFSFTPFPSSALHHARIGFHNLARDWLGEGTLNFRAGMLLLLDFQRPGHRFLAPGPNHVDAVTVGSNGFSFDGPALGAQIYGRPTLGPWFYELSVVAGDPGSGVDRDDWKDVFGRTAWTFFQNSDHEVTAGVFAYVGRSEFDSVLGGITLRQRDDFWIVGGDIACDVGPLNISALGWQRHHGDPNPEGGAVSVSAVRVEALVGVTRDLVVGLRGDRVLSSEDESLKRGSLVPHLSYAFAANALGSLVWAQDLENSAASLFMAVLDVVL